MMKDTKSALEQALASRRGKGMDLTIIMGGHPEIEVDTPERAEEEVKQAQGDDLYAPDAEEEEEKEVEEMSPESMAMHEADAKPFPPSANPKPGMSLKDRVLANMKGK